MKRLITLCGCLISMSNFEQAWKKRHPKSLPVGFMMRKAGEPNWLRFHSLPCSKRYADSAEEKEILLARQNELAAQVLGSGNPVWLVQAVPEMMPSYTDEQVTACRDSTRACRDYSLTSAFRFIVAEDDDEEIAWDVHAAQTVWESGKFDDLLWDIANDQACKTLWMSVSTGAVFAPYDGGVDLFLPTQHMLQDLRSKHASWLSKHPCGL